MNKLAPGDLVLVMADVNFGAFQYGKIESIPFEDKPNIYSVQIDGKSFLFHEDLLTYIEQDTIVLTEKEAKEIERLGIEIDKRIDEIDEFEQRISDIIEEGKKRKP